MKFDERRWAVLFLILYKVSLDLSYHYIVPIGGYYATSVVDMNPLKVLESYIFFFLLIALAPSSTDTLGKLLLWLMILFSYIPMLTVYGMANESRLFMYATTGFWVIVCRFCPAGKQVSLKPPGEVLGRKINVSMFMGLTALALLTVVAYRGFQFLYDVRMHIPSQMSDVYDIREDWVDLGLPLHGYWFHWLACVFNPIFFAISIVRKKWIHVALIVYLQLIVSLMVGTRTYFLDLPFVLVLMWIVSRKRPLSLLAAGLAVIIIFSSFFSYLLNDWFPYNFLVRRLLCVSAELTFHYYDFFSGHHLLHLSYIFNNFFNIRGLVHDPYGVSPDLLIGETYFGMPSLAAVSGIVADGYMNFGVLGIAIWSMFLAGILRVLDKVSGGVDLRVGVAALAVPALSFSQTYMVRTLFTAGFVLALIVLYCLPRGNLSAPVGKKTYPEKRQRAHEHLLQNPVE